MWARYSLAEYVIQQVTYDKKCEQKNMKSVVYKTYKYMSFAWTHAMYNAQVWLYKMSYLIGDRTPLQDIHYIDLEVTAITLCS